MGGYFHLVSSHQFHKSFASAADLIHSYIKSSLCSLLIVIMHHNSFLSSSLKSYHAKYSFGSP